MRRASFRRLVAAPLALWVMGVLAVPGLDACPMHGLHAPAPARAGMEAPHEAMASMGAHGHAASTDHAPAAPADPAHTCHCPGDCSTSDGVFIATNAVTWTVSSEVDAEAREATRVATLPSDRTEYRQPPSIGPPRA